MENDFIYARAFMVSDALLFCDKVLLRCEGLDTLILPARPSCYLFIHRVIIGQR